MRVIVIANQKGGIGKTTTATTLASIFSSRGLHTLLIDADEQGNSTDTYKAKIDGEATLFDVILEDADQRVSLNEAIQHTESGDIVASDPLLRTADPILKNDVDGVYRLKDAIDALEGYDVVIIDTHPSINAILHSSLIAADEIIIPLTSDRYAMQGLSQLTDTIRSVQKRQNPGLSIDGFLLVKYDRRTLLGREAKEVLSRVAAENGTKLFETTIRESESVKQAQATRMPLIEFAPKSTAALDYQALADELMEV